MRIRSLGVDIRPFEGAVPGGFARLDAGRWKEAACIAREGGHRLVALWGTDRRPRENTLAIIAAYALPEGLCVLELVLDPARAAYPDLSGLFPAANRMQRAVRDLLGLVADGAADNRQWLRHGAWSEGAYPLRCGFDAATASTAEQDRYPFVRVEGDGVHEIPVGPIHAGIIEPGHFRFSIVGEKVLRLEGRLGYTHK